MANFKEKVKEFWYKYEEDIVVAAVALVGAIANGVLVAKAYKNGWNDGASVGAQALVGVLDTKYPDKEVGKLVGELIESKVK